MNEHGVDGATAATWLHTSEDEQLSAEAEGRAVQEATGPALYALYLRTEREFTAAELRDYAGELRRLASQLDATADRFPQGWWQG